MKHELALINVFQLKNEVRLSIALHGAVRINPIIVRSTLGERAPLELDHLALKQNKHITLSTCPINIQHLLNTELNDIAGTRPETRLHLAVQ